MAEIGQSVRTSRAYRLMYDPASASAPAPAPAPAPHLLFGALTWHRDAADLSMGETFWLPCDQLAGGEIPSLTMVRVMEL